MLWTSSSRVLCDAWAAVSLCLRFLFLGPCSARGAFHQRPHIRSLIAGRRGVAHFLTRAGQLPEESRSRAESDDSGASSVRIRSRVAQVCLNLAGALGRSAFLYKWLLATSSMLRSSPARSLHALFQTVLTVRDTALPLVGLVVGSGDSLRARANLVRRLIHRGLGWRSEASFSFFPQDNDGVHDDSVVGRPNFKRRRVAAGECRVCPNSIARSTAGRGVTPHMGGVRQVPLVWAMSQMFLVQVDFQCSLAGYCEVTCLRIFA